MLVEERFELNPQAVRVLHERPVPLDEFGQTIAMRTYSRTTQEGKQELWPDIVHRVVNGVGSIRKDWYVKHRLPWDETKWQEHMTRMAMSMFEMRFLPPGRGLWAMGTDYCYQRGSAALYNCAYTAVNKLSYDASWAMDFLMSGIGVGFGEVSSGLHFQQPSEYTEIYIIPDTREGWVEATRRLIESYETGGKTQVFDYSQVRPAGLPIKGFGGTASGPDPLIKLHQRIRNYFAAYISGTTSRTRLVADIFNAIGACVVAGNVRRSAEIYLGSVRDSDFLTLKDFSRYDGNGQLIYQGSRDDRQEIGWMSNNSVVLSQYEDFQRLPDVAELAAIKGEPGIMNLRNIQKYGRYGEEMYDPATGSNPCAEIALENKEVCNLVEIFPTRCTTDNNYYEALELGQIYAHTVSLLPTNSEETNAVVARNRRIGESLSGIADWFDQEGASRIITKQREGYKLVREANKKLAQAAGVPESIRVTTVKPSGTISILAGVSSGMHYPPALCSIRRVRVGANTPIAPILIDANIPYEEDKYSDNTLVFEFPLRSKAKRSQRDLSLWQKGAMVVMLQQHWADNMVSNTITFDPKTEAKQLPDFFAMYVPLIKTMSVLPDEEGVYEQAPFEPITVAEYERRKKQLRTIDWTKFGGSDGQDSRFCTTDHCEV